MIEVYLKDGNILKFDLNDHQGIKKFMDGNVDIEEFQVKEFHKKEGELVVITSYVQVKLNKNYISYIVG